jgi:NADPH:quinone reductase-like Zn-dependent oxidoreductase
MKAARISEFGYSEKMNIETISKPAPGMNEVLVRVLGAGINPLDAVMGRRLKSSQVGGCPSE